MFDFSAAEFLVIALVALIVIGPRELPGLLRQFGQMVGKVRRMASEFQEQLNNAVEHSEVQEIKKDLKAVADKARIEVDYNPAVDAEREIREAVHGTKPTKIQNPDYGNDPDDALVEFPSADADKTMAAKPTGEGDSRLASQTVAKPAGKDNAIVREPSTPRPAGKRLPVTTGTESPVESVATGNTDPDGKPASVKG